jgi:hypothetical protein
MLHLLGRTPKKIFVTERWGFQKISEWSIKSFCGFFLNLLFCARRCSSACPGSWLVWGRQDRHGRVTFEVTRASFESRPDSKTDNQSNGNTQWKSYFRFSSVLFCVLFSIEHKRKRKPELSLVVRFIFHSLRLSQENKT